MTRQQRRAARLRAKADRLDPDGVTRPLLLPEGGQYHVTWEECCQVHYFSGQDVGAPLFYLAGDERRLRNETTYVADEPLPLPHQ